MREQRGRLTGSNSVTGTATVLPDHLLWARRRADSLSAVPYSPFFLLEVCDDAPGLARVAHLSVDEVARRREHGNRPYVARVGHRIVSYGWCCQGTAEWSGRNLTLSVEGGHRYLWDFATVPEWRGHGLYPMLIAWIVRSERRGQIFWIIHDRENDASQRGIVKAGFQCVAALYDQPGGRVRLGGSGDSELLQLARVVFRDLF